MHRQRAAGKPAPRAVAGAQPELRPERHAGSRTAERQSLTVRSKSSGCSRLSQANGSVDASGCCWRTGGVVPVTSCQRALKKSGRPFASAVQIGCGMPSTMARNRRLAGAQRRRMAVAFRQQFGGLALPAPRAQRGADRADQADRVQRTLQHGDIAQRGRQPGRLLRVRPRRPVAQGEQDEREIRPRGLLRDPLPQRARVARARPPVRSARPRHPRLPGDPPARRGTRRPRCRCRPAPASRRSPRRRVRWEPGPGPGPALENQRSASARVLSSAFEVPT